MNRRELLKAIGAVGLSLPILLDQSVLAAVGSSTPGVMMMNRFSAAGTAKQSFPAFIEISRLVNRSSLMSFHMNAYGGFLEWWASLPEEIFFLPGDWPVVQCPAVINWAMPLFDINDSRESVVIGSSDGRRYKELLLAPD